MIKTIDMLLNEHKTFTDTYNKISRQVVNGEYTRIVRGLYETNPHTPPHLLAGSIYGPSYISFEYTISLYGLIPERVYTCTSATYKKSKTKQYDTPLGTFTYRDIPKTVYPLDIQIKFEDGYAYQIASPEKALCDSLYARPTVKNQTALSELLFKDMRIDYDSFTQLNTEKLLSLSPQYKSSNLRLFFNMLKRSQLC